MKKINKIIVLCICVMFVFAPSVKADLGDTIRVSVASDGTEGNDNSSGAQISADNRYVVFTSDASNLVAGDTNGFKDIFLRDMETGTTTRLSVNSNGEQANGYSEYPSISADGRFVAFLSTATNLITGDTFNSGGIFVLDRQTGSFTRVSMDYSGTQVISSCESPEISGNGRYVAFSSYANNLVIGDTNDREDIFVHDLQTGITTRVSVSSEGEEGNKDSYNPSISADGRYVAFQSEARTLVEEDTTDWNIYVHDRDTGETTLITPHDCWFLTTWTSCSSQAPTITGDGRYVAFQSKAFDLVGGDNNGMEDIFVYDMQTNSTTRASVDSNGVEGNGVSGSAALSEDGRYVSFRSHASNLVFGDINGEGDLFVHDMQTGITMRVPFGLDAAVANGYSGGNTFSADGWYLLFTSSASNLIAGDTNDMSDIFMQELDFSGPQIVFGDASVPASNGATLTSAPARLTVQFNQDMLSDGSQHAVNSTQNYMLVSPGENGSFDTGITSAAICDAAHTPEGDDVGINITEIVYSSANRSATLKIDPAVSSLPNGQYRLYVCGEQSVWNVSSIPLNDGSNAQIDFIVENEAAVPLTLGHYEQDDGKLTYTGTWGTASAGDASGGSFAYSSDGSARVSFSFVGSHAIIHRNVGPDRGNVEVWVDSSLFGTMNNHVEGHAGYAGYPIMGLVDGTHEVELVFSSGSYMDLDAIDIVEPIADGRYDDVGTSAAAFDSWWGQTTGSSFYNGTTSYTDADAAKVTIPVEGTDVILMQTMGPDKGDVDLFIDGAYHSSINNNYIGHIGYQSGTMVNGLSAGEHILELRNASSGAYMDFDGVVVFSPFNADTTAGDDHQNLAYRGEWLTYSMGNLHDGNMHWTSDTSACVKFTFEGTTAKLMRALGPDRGEASVSVDGNPYGTMNNYLGDGLGFQSGYLITGLSDSTHVAEMCFSNGYFMDLDAVVVYDPVTPSTGQIDDSDIRIAYNGSWDVANMEGPLNNTMHYSSKEDATIWLRFDGSRLEITRFIGPDRGDVDVYIDGEYKETYSNYAMPGYAAFQRVIVINYLGSGEHTLELRNASPGTYMSIDAFEVTDW